MNKTISTGCVTTVNQLHKQRDGYKCSNFNFAIFRVFNLIGLQYMHIVTAKITLTCLNFALPDPPHSVKWP